MIIEQHWLQGARKLPSPNQGPRINGDEISLLVIHNISLPPGQFGGPHIDALFCNQLDCSVHAYFDTIKHLHVSSHLLINRQGEITQYVPFDCQAWHAGLSSFEDRDKCNEYSIGIELEGTDDESFTAEQYQSLASVSIALLEAYPGINSNRIVGHSDIAPGRKTDPGPNFDWRSFYDMITTS